MPLDACGGLGALPAGAAGLLRSVYGRGHVAVTRHAARGTRKSSVAQPFDAARGAGSSRSCYQLGRCGAPGRPAGRGVAPGCCSASPGVRRATDPVERADADQPFQQFGQRGRRWVAQILVGLRDVTGDVGGRDPGPELVGQPTADVIEGCHGRDVERVLLVGGDHAGDGNQTDGGGRRGTPPERHLLTLG